MGENDLTIVQPLLGSRIKDQDRSRLKTQWVPKLETDPKLETAFEVL